MINNNHWRKCIVNLIIILILAGCRPIEPNIPPDDILQLLGDGGILSQDPCGPPCFLNLVPGESTYADVVRVFEELEIMEWCSLDYSPESVYCIRIPPDWYALSVIFDQNMVIRSISFRLEHSIPLEDVISEYGNPSTLLFYWYLDMNLYTIKGQIYYDDLYTVFSLIDQGNVAYNLSRDTMIEAVLYCSSLTYHDCHDMPELEVEWHGYGVYEGIDLLGVE